MITKLQFSIKMDSDNNEKKITCRKKRQGRSIKEIKRRNMLFFEKNFGYSSSRFFIFKNRMRRKNRGILEGGGEGKGKGRGKEGIRCFVFFVFLDFVFVVFFFFLPLKEKKWTKNQALFQRVPNSLFYHLENSTCSPKRERIRRE